MMNDQSLVDRSLTCDGRNDVTDAKRLKIVRFHLSPRFIPCVATLKELTPEECFHGWWQPEEYEVSRGTARTLCRTMRQITGATECVGDAYDCGFENIETLHAAQVLVPNESLRGLERWTCKSYALSRYRDSAGAKHAVLLEQARQFLFKAQDDEVIANVSRQKSGKARAFAALMGHADAVAAQQQQQQQQHARPPPRRPSEKSLNMTIRSQEQIRMEPVSDESSSDEQETTVAPIFISIKTIV